MIQIYSYFEAKHYESSETNDLEIAFNAQLLIKYCQETKFVAFREFSVQDVQVLEAEGIKVSLNDLELEVGGPVPVKGFVEDVEKLEGRDEEEILESFGTTGYEEPDRASPTAPSTRTTAAQKVKQTLRSTSENYILEATIDHYCRTRVNSKRDEVSGEYRAQGLEEIHKDRNLTNKTVQQRIKDDRKTTQSDLAKVLGNDEAAAEFSLKVDRFLTRAWVNIGWFSLK
ncbi:hypothetical protein HYALB_00010257 [Hymenoscyphus albidus]|uniref:Uncharacterized protein n=1 Tax=Hymenoscyphus albidus TaxID=595503 RepID=A0A9N9LQS1_9HELO|nr:hypothetical protein HYALB_00010257 [Hymenoscyphus albidus]